MSPWRKNDPKTSDPLAQKCAKKLRPLGAFEGVVKHDGDEDDDTAGDTDVCDVEYREFDEVKADEVNNVARDEAVDRIANAT